MDQIMRTINEMPKTDQRKFAPSYSNRDCAVYGLHISLELWPEKYLSEMFPSESADLFVMDLFLPLSS